MSATACGNDENPDWRGPCERPVGHPDYHYSGKTLSHWSRSDMPECQCTCEACARAPMTLAQASDEIRRLRAEVDALWPRAASGRKAIRCEPCSTLHRQSVYWDPERGECPMCKERDATRVFYDPNKPPDGNGWRWETGVGMWVRYPAAAGK